MKKGQSRIVKTFEEFETDDYPAPEYVCEPAKDDSLFFYLKGKLKKRFRLVTESSSPEFTERTEVGAKVLHTASPKNRESIRKNGLLPQIGDSYSLHYDENESLRPAIFALDISKTKERYDSTWDDDIWEIDTTKANVEWFLDTGAWEGCIVTFEKIPPTCIKLIYKGTGKSQ
jgi:hypothetical protein